MELIKRYWWMLFIYILMVVSFMVDWGTYDSEIQKTIYLIAPLVTTIVGYRALNKIGWVGRRSQVIFWVWIGIVLWFIAEAILLYLDIQNLEPYPSWADFFFLIGYPVFFLSVLKEWRIFELNIFKLDKVLLTVLVLLGLVVIGIVVYLGIFVGYDPEETWFINLVGFSWSLGDLFIGFCSMILLAMIWEFIKGRVRFAWLAFMLWGTINLIADTLYGLFPDALFDASPLSILLDSMWVFGYFLIAFYFNEIRLEVESALKRIKK